MKFLVYEDQQIIKALSYYDILYSRQVEPCCLLHNDNVFEQARDYFYQYNENTNSCIPVIDETGECIYLLEFFENLSKDYLQDGLIYRKFETYLWEIESYMGEQSSLPDNLFASNLRFNKDTLQYCINHLPKEFLQENRILGVVARGTDYKKEAIIARATTPIHVPSAPLLLIIKRAKAVMELWNCNYIYLATEDEDYLDAFRESFGESLIYKSQVRVRYNTDEINSKYLSELLQPDDPEQFGRDYLSILYCLSKCNVFISSMNCRASFAARSFNQGQFEYDSNV